MRDLPHSFMIPNNVTEAWWDIFWFPGNLRNALNHNLANVISGGLETSVNEESHVRKGVSRENCKVSDCEAAWDWFLTMHLKLSSHMAKSWGKTDLFSSSQITWHQRVGGMNAWLTRTSPATYPAIVRHSGLSLIQPETGETGDAPGNWETRNQ